MRRQLNNILHTVKGGAPLILCAVLTLPLSAQELKENVAIEGHYAPKIIKVDKIHTFPQQIEADLQHTIPVYSQDGVISDFNPDLLPLPPTSWEGKRTLPAYKGYLNVDLGSWLGSNISAGYQLIRTKTTTLSTSLQHNSTSLWRASDDTPSKRFRYDETLQVLLSHDMGAKGSLQGGVSYHLGYFNYYMMPDTKAPTQSLNDATLNLQWHSQREPLENKNRNRWDASLSWRSFNYRAFYCPPLQQSFSADRENHLTLSGNFSLGNHQHKLVVEAAVNALLYAKSNFYTSPDIDILLPELLSPEGCDFFVAPKNYMLITITPRWVYDVKNIHLTAGASFDITANAVGSHYNEHYSLFHVSPYIKGSADFKAATLWATITGGTRLHTMASDADMFYYSSPLLAARQPSFSPLDATVGVNLQPFNGFTAQLSAGYKIQLHTPISGWYPYMIANDLQAALGAYSTEGIDLRGAEFNLQLSYQPLSRLKASAGACYTPQNYRFGIYNGPDRARCITNASLSFIPFQKLNLTLDYLLRMGRKIYTYTPEDMTLQAMKLRNISSLNFTASFNLLDNLTLTLRANNILNRKIDLLPGLADNGAEFYGGIQWLF